MSCPKCGGETGYYESSIVSYQQDFTWDGK